MATLLSNIVDSFRLLFGMTPAAPVPVETPVETLPLWKFQVQNLVNTRYGRQRRMVAESSVYAKTRSAALHMIVNVNRQAYPGEIVKIDGLRFRVWQTENGLSVTPIDPANRAVAGDRARHRAKNNL